MNKGDTIYVSGHAGLVGGSIVRALKSQGFTNVWTTPRKETDLLNANAVNWFFGECKPDYVFHCAAKVGGIADNVRDPAGFLLENLQIQGNVLNASRRHAVKKLLFMASAAVYPDKAQSPLAPQKIMTGWLDETKSGYAMAKLVGMQICHEFRKQFGCNFISAIPNNVYGLGDRSSHLIPDLIRRFRHFKESAGNPVCWGTGNARRELIFADDVADACLFLMEHYNQDAPINIGVGRDWSIREIAHTVSSVVGCQKEILWDETKPEGTQQRLLDCSAINSLGWSHKTSLLTGLEKTYEDFLKPK